MKKITRVLFASMALASLLDVNFLIAADREANHLAAAAQDEDAPIVAKTFQVQIDDQELNVEVLNTRGDGDCAFRALAPEEIWRGEAGVCRNWAANLLRANLNDAFVAQCIATEIEYRRNSGQLPHVLQEMLEAQEDLALDNPVVLETYIDSFILPVTNDYLEENPGLEANFLEFPSEVLRFSAANALAHIMRNRLVIVESNEGFVIYDDADVANIPEDFGTQEEREAELARRTALPILMVAQDAFGGGEFNFQENGEEMNWQMLQVMQQSLTQHEFRVRILPPANPAANPNPAEAPAAEEPLAQTEEEVDQHAEEAPTELQQQEEDEDEVVARQIIEASKQKEEEVKDEEKREETKEEEEKKEETAADDSSKKTTAAEAEKKQKQQQSAKSKKNHKKRKGGKKRK